MTLSTDSYGVKIGMVITGIILMLVLVQVIILFAIFLRGCWQHFVVQELNLLERYGHGSYAVITGASGGQGREYALALAKRGFNLILLGSIRCKNVLDEIVRLYPHVHVVVLVKNFCRANEPGFFDDIEALVRYFDVSLLINNVAYRKGYIPSHQQPEQEIRDIMACSMMVQVRMSQLCIPLFLQRRPKKSGMICTAAMISHPCLGFAVGMSGHISIPLLNCYEASNAFRFYQAMGLYKEYGHLMDFLIPIPGATLTAATRPVLHDTFGAVEAEVLVANVLRMLGNVQGEVCGYWKHAACQYLVNLVPWMKDGILEKTGRAFAMHTMHQPPKKYE